MILMPSGLATILRKEKNGNEIYTLPTLIRTDNLDFLRTPGFASMVVKPDKPLKNL